MILTILLSNKNTGGMWKKEVPFPCNVELVVCVYKCTIKTQMRE